MILGLSQGLNSVQGRGRQVQRDMELSEQLVAPKQ